MFSLLDVLGNKTIQIMSSMPVPMPCVVFWLKCWSFVGQAAQLHSFVLLVVQRPESSIMIKKYAAALLVAFVGVWILQQCQQRGAVDEDQDEEEEEETQDEEDDQDNNAEPGEWATCEACDQVRFIEDCYDPFCYGCFRDCQC